MSFLPLHPLTSMTSLRLVLLTSEFPRSLAVISEELDVLDPTVIKQVTMATAVSQTHQN